MREATVRAEHHPTVKPVWPRRRGVPLQCPLRRSVAASFRRMAGVAEALSVDEEALSVDEIYQASGVREVP
jgi:hypothetical protein